MKRTVAILYLIVYSIMIFAGLLASINMGNVSFSLLLNSAASVVFIIGGIGYIRETAIANANFWNGVFYLSVLLIALTALLQLSAHQYFIVLFVVAMNLPIILMLRSYSNEHAKYWVSEKDQERGNLLASYLQSNDQLELESKVQKITLTRSPSGFHSHIEREEVDQKLEYSEEFANAGAMLRYIEKYTSFKLEDFSNKYE